MSDQDQAAKIYCGNAKTIKTQYGDLTKISFTAEDVQKMTDNLNNGWINVVLKERRSPSQAGFTHYLEVDTWKPKEGAEGGKAPASSSAPAAVTEKDMSPEDLPF